MSSVYNVAIVGGGPGGATAGSLLKKYNPDLNVVILERERFPRDHVGESQLPPISRILNEMGCWDDVEAANFPIKIGVTYRWGKNPELWDFEFLPKGTFRDEPRPAKFEGQRLHTAFQVDRAVYDQILLTNARRTGCEVREETKVVRVHREKNRVESIELESGERIEAEHYIDASGHSGIIRRAMDVPVTVPTSLQNIAIWDYWENADWAIEIGVGGTRVQVMSQGYGWIWFIPLSPTRTSIGLIVPAEYYKTAGKTPEELYRKAISDDERIASLTMNAEREHKTSTTKDWSFLASRLYGDNWWLVGESAGFADPILAAGLTLTQQSARELAYSILEIERGHPEVGWIKEQYEKRQIQKMRNHIRFADFWYSANAQFTDLQEFTAQLAADNGLNLSPKEAWAWLSQGGFIEDAANFGAAGFSLDQVKALGDFIVDLDASDFVSKNNVFRLDISGATWSSRSGYLEGKIIKEECLLRGEKLLPLTGPVDLLVQILQRFTKLPDIRAQLIDVARRNEHNPTFMKEIMLPIGNALEAMISDGWVKPSYDPSLPLVEDPKLPTGISKNVDPAIA